MKRFRMLTVFLVVAGFVLGASFVFAADLNGTWNLSVTTPNGNGNPVFKIKQTGNKLTGHYSGQFGESEIKGKVRGNDFDIKFYSSGVNITYTGTAGGDKMSGKIDFGGQGRGNFTGVRSASK